MFYPSIVTRINKIYHHDQDPLHLPFLSHLLNARAMTFSIRTTFILLVAAAFLQTVLANKNPCHNGRNVDVQGAPCEGVIIPKKLCRKCRLGDFDELGNFGSCRAIYMLDEPACKEQLEKYVSLNPCDTTRAAQLAGFNVTMNRQSLDYFVYSVCEECCDCVPAGSRPEQFAMLKALGVSKLTSVVRGNCPAHAHYDICKLWPEIRHVASEDKPLRLNLPKVCPMLKSWVMSPAGKNWISNNDAVINNDIKRFLNIFNSVAKCRSKNVWQKCAALETAQDRI